MLGCYPKILVIITSMKSLTPLLTPFLCYTYLSLCCTYLFLHITYLFLRITHLFSALLLHITFLSKLLTPLSVMFRILISFLVIFVLLKGSLSRRIGCKKIYVRQSFSFYNESMHDATISSFCMWDCLACLYLYLHARSLMIASLLAFCVKNNKTAGISL